VCRRFESCRGRRLNQLLAAFSCSDSRKVAANAALFGHRASETTPDAPMQEVDGGVSSVSSEGEGRMPKFGGRGMRLRVAAGVCLVTVLGMASLAAASPGPPGHPAPDLERGRTPPSTHAVTTTVPTGVEQTPIDLSPHEQAVPDPAPLEGTDTAPPAGTCLTHGERVSAVAHATPPGAGHGAAVRAVAHDHTGECTHTNDGTDDRADDTADTQPPSVSTPSPAESDASEPSAHERSGGGMDSPGHGLGRGHGNGKH